MFIVGKKTFEVNKTRGHGIPRPNENRDQRRGNIAMTQLDSFPAPLPKSLPSVPRSWRPSPPHSSWCSWLSVFVTWRSCRPTSPTPRWISFLVSQSLVSSTNPLKPLGPPPNHYLQCEHWQLVSSPPPNLLEQSLAASCWWEMSVQSSK